MGTRWLAEMTAAKVRQMEHEEAGETRLKARELAARERDARSSRWIELELICLRVILALVRMRVLNIKEM